MATKKKDGATRDAQEAPGMAPEAAGGQPPVDAAGDAQEPPVDAPGRVVAFCRRSCRIYLDGGLHTVLGGEILDHAAHVEQVHTDTQHFRLIQVRDAEQIQDLRDGWAALFSEARRHLAAAGIAVYRDGEVTPPKRESAVHHDDEPDDGALVELLQRASRHSKG